METPENYERVITEFGQFVRLTVRLALISICAKDSHDFIVWLLMHED